VLSSPQALLPTDLPPTGRKRVFWVKSGPVAPPNTGGRLRTYETLKALHAEHEVFFLALGEPEPGAAQDYASQVEFVPHRVDDRRSLKFILKAVQNLVQSSPLSLELYRSKQLERRVREVRAAFCPDLIVCDFLTPAPSFPRELRAESVLFQHNIEALIWRRMADNAAGGLKRWYLEGQYQRMRRMEGELSRDFARVITVSAQDSELARQDYGLTNVAGHVQTGVDEGAFQSVWAVAKKPGLVGFLGSMDWMPNDDGVSWFLDGAWAQWVARRPGLAFRVIGRKPSASLLGRWNGRLGVEFTGTVDDVKPFLGELEVGVVPLRVGGGTRLKILELMAAGVPVVSTSVGAEGLPVQDGRHILLADSLEQMTEAVESLLDDPERREMIRRAALEEIVRPASWSSVARDFLRLATYGK
jgi:polysaccharide biosynthesis protein PslH